MTQTQNRGWTCVHTCTRASAHLHTHARPCMQPDTRVFPWNPHFHSLKKTHRYKASNVRFISEMTRRTMPTTCHLLGT